MEPILKAKSKSPLSHKYKMHARPKLRRETAQDVEDGELYHDELHPDLASSEPRKATLSPNVFLRPTSRKLIHQKSAPGTPMSPQRYSQGGRPPSRTPSDESSGYLSVPKQRLRGSSISGDAELSLRKVLKFRH